MKIHKEKTIKKIILVLLIMILGSTLIELGTNIKSLYMKNQNKKELQMKPILLKMLFNNNIINHSTYKKVKNQYNKGKDVA